MRRFNKNDKEKDKNPANYVLPSPGILESYEELAPGSASKIINLIEKEQKHRAEYENNMLKILQQTQQRQVFFTGLILLSVLFANIIMHYINANATVYSWFFSLLFIGWILPGAKVHSKQKLLLSSMLLICSASLLWQQIWLLGCLSIVLAAYIALYKGHNHHYKSYRK